jgi:energy-coupling factor transporter ATP-binding protein EcfA2
MEGKGETAEQSPSPGIAWRASEAEHDQQPDQAQQAHQLGQPQPAQQADLSNQAHDTDIVNSMAAPDDEMGENQVPGGELVPRGGGQPASAGYQPGVTGSWHESRVRVDARLLEATLLNLRKRISAIPLVFDLPGATDVEAERAKLLSQIDDYLLPRVRQSAAPILVALVGSTGAGKSTLVNSIVGTQVSLTGIRRPTTNSPVLACHPDDIGWFAENMFLPTLPRVRQEGLARPGRDGLLVLAASEGMTKGVALLDTPDIDSVVRAHYDFAYQFLDASDLWLFMTSASRYADAPVWEILQHARERGAALGVILSRVPPAHRTELVTHFDAMLAANGIVPGKRFVIPETGIVDGMLPIDVLQPVKDWLTETAQYSDRRVAVLTQTMAGVLDTFKFRVPRLAAHVDAQVSLRTRLRYEAEAAYGTALKEFDQSTRNARLLRGEVLARWQEFVGTGELLKSLETQVGFVRDRVMGWVKGRPSQADKVTVAVESGLETLILDHAESAAERAHASWRSVAAGQHVLEDSGRELSRASRDFRARAERTVRDWQQDVLDMVRREGADKRSTARFLALGVNGLGLALMVVVFAQTAGLTGAEVGIAGGSAVLGQKLLEAVFGDQAVRRLATDAREDLNRRVRELLATERARYTELLDGLKISADDADRLRAASRRVDDVRFAAQLGEEAIT